MSHSTKIAQAKRQLRRIEEDEPLFHLRIKELSRTQQTIVQGWFTEILERQRKHVRELEDLDSDTR